MIKSASIRNYQSIRSLDIAFGRVTVIVGHSDAGKSAFLRALQAVCFNQEGSEFIHRKRVGETVIISPPAAVALTLEDGHMVVWQRYEKSHKYMLVRPDGSKLEFEKTGGQVPSDIQTLLAIYPVQVEDTKKERVHFAFQHQLPFLVGDRGGVGANRVLGRLTGLHIFANAAKLCTSERDKNNRSLEVARQQLESARQQLASMPDLISRKLQLDGLRTRYALSLNLRARVAGWKNQDLLRRTSEDTIAVLKTRIDNRYEAVGVRVNGLDLSVERLRRLQALQKSLMDSVEKFKSARSQVGVTPQLGDEKLLQLKKFNALNSQVFLLKKQLNDLLIEVKIAESAESTAHEELLSFSREHSHCPFQSQFAGIQNPENYLCPLVRSRS